MEISFLLKDKTKKTTSIRLQARFDGNLFRYPTGISLKPKEWSLTRQKVHSAVANSESINLYLDNLKKAVKDEYLKQITNKEIPTVEHLKEFLDKNFKRKEEELTYLTEYLDEFIARKNRQLEGSTIKGYISLRNHLIEYEQHIEKKLTFKSLNQKAYDDLIEYFAYEKGMENRTIKERYLKNLNSFLNWAVTNEYLVKNPLKGIVFPFKMNPLNAISLDEEELHKIYHLNLSDNQRLDWARDVLCLECYSGLRFSDLRNIEPHKLKGNSLEVVVQKGKKKLDVPLRPEALAIIKKYFDNNLPFPSKTNQKTNDYLKELGKLAEIIEPITSLRLSGINRIEETKPKHEMITTHTGRRTFVTLSYQKGMRILDIMAITGHSDLKSFMRYYKLDKIKVHDNFHKAWAQEVVTLDLKDILKNLLINKVDKEVVAKSCNISLEKLEELISN